ncbi:MAG: hypothetical protein K0R90_1175 [Oscillospiraceae bacterium]|nr:hypothetical protein [Oscillospiraceae bacterium]
MEENSYLAKQLLETFHNFMSKKAKQASMSGTMQGEMAVLMCLYHHNKEGTFVGPSQISDFLDIQRPNVTISLNALEQKGYIIRRKGSDNKDKRKINVEITDKGIEFVEKKFDASKKMALHIVDQLGKSQTEEFIRLLNLIFSYTEQYQNNCRERNE